MRVEKSTENFILSYKLYTFSYFSNFLEAEA
jgi:hypothetical protein